MVQAHWGAGQVPEAWAVAVAKGAGGALGFP
jgi:hypothetical protein